MADSWQETMNQALEGILGQPSRYPTLVSNILAAVDVKILAKLVLPMIDRRSPAWRQLESLAHYTQECNTTEADLHEPESTIPLEFSECFTRPIGLDCGNTPTAGRYPPDSDALSS
jgi:hypothetical protein